MNILDIVFIIILVVSFFSGFGTGLVKGVFSLIGVILGLVLASNLYDSFADSTMGRVIAFIVIFLIVAVVLSIVGSVVKKLVHAVMLGWLDRLGGAFFGLVSAGLFITLALVAYISFFGPNDLITNSVVSRLLMDKLSWVVALLPDKFTQPVKPFLY
jgi:membrane protein required for colicin V production